MMLITSQVSKRLQIYLAEIWDHQENRFQARQPQRAMTEELRCLNSRSITQLTIVSFGEIGRKREIGLYNRQSERIKEE